MADARASTRAAESQRWFFETTAYCGPAGVHSCSHSPPTVTEVKTLPKTLFLFRFRSGFSFLLMWPAGLPALFVVTLGWGVEITAPPPSCTQSTSVAALLFFLPLDTVVVAAFSCGRRDQCLFICRLFESVTTNSHHAAGACSVDVLPCGFFSNSADEQTV